MNDDDDKAARDDGSAAQERIYLLRRAEDHRKLASRAVEANIRATHRLMQQLYEERADRAIMMHSD